MYETDEQNLDRLVAELEQLRDEILASSKAADEVLQDRIDEIKN